MSFLSLKAFSICIISSWSFRDAFAVQVPSSLQCKEKPYFLAIHSFTSSFAVCRTFSQCRKHSYWSPGMEVALGYQRPGENSGICGTVGCGLSAWTNYEDLQGRAVPSWVTCPPAPWSGQEKKLEERIVSSVFLVAVIFIQDFLVKRGNFLNTAQKQFREKNTSPSTPFLAKTKICVESMGTRALEDRYKDQRMKRSDHGQ